MNTYYRELSELVYGRFGIDPYERVVYGYFYLTIQDYLLAVSNQDPVKNIYCLLRSFHNSDQALNYLKETISRIIEETVWGDATYTHSYQNRMKEMT
ncbi:hypothetical protein [Fervidibacillus albus]|uniref:Uncharacterized protein n=1 Tax=Fervidibacillus albus TaxID=2980026 RepID=A0A9E8RUT3_9BACI|nr:hypothetical protein [Fervidibacillus albus]WAA08579.1 hypothetical protein OE104_07955 [Fervidibacillus albus]